ncbi:Glucose-methanol-choline oxidoreductase [Botryosphaeria dothidea]|uniref:Glucose-methanol-choline oxidoreductase n=1 Tax=Botryosphaeria dothidea TaxID=55169 RepID=A0A8H4IYH6_9PEZI|nr:Glucose-methanol-choline oxidoreductase [Botryosphaeria dothidea]
MRASLVLLSFCSQTLAAPQLFGPLADLLGNVGGGKGFVDTALGALGGAVGVTATYDYVVVGGGTAGNTIGVRLAEAGYSVAIIEAGGYYQIGKPLLTTSPAGDVFNIGMSMSDASPLVDWMFETQPQDGANGRTFHYARGKCLGGSSALNFMIYQRGTAQCYDQWAETLGDDSWSWANTQKHFKNSFTFTPPNDAKRGTNVTTKYNPSAFSAGSPGPVQVGYTNFVSAAATWLEKGMAAVGIKPAADFNSGTLLGGAYLSTTIRPSDATKSGSDQFITRAKSNPKLKVYIKTLAKKILFDNNKKATGVAVDTAGIKYTINTRKEVIVSAGAFQSPQLLMVSGIGPAAYLQSFGINVLSDLAGVGQNMWDHIMFGPSYQVNLVTLNKVIKDPLYAAKRLTDYITTRTGELSSNVVEYLGWEKLSSLASYAPSFSPTTKQQLAQFPSDWPEAEWLTINSYIEDFLTPVADVSRQSAQHATILGAIVAPTSRGNVTLRSADTQDLPLINPNWLTAPADVELAIAMYKRMREIWATPAMRASDAQIHEQVKRSLTTVWHAACTCRMGRGDDAGAVLDARARVFGVGALRVVDASSFPTLPPGHPQSTVYMVAEKIAADIINGS